MKLPLVSAAAVLVFGFATSAFSGPIPGGPPSFRIGVTSSEDPNGLELSLTLTAKPDGSYSASGSATSADHFSVAFDFTNLNPDPAVVGSFTLRNLSMNTQTFSVSATLGVLPIGAPTRIGGSVGGIVYTDTDNAGNPGDGTLGLGTPGSDPFYEAMIDVVPVHVLGSFVFSPITAGSGVQLTLNQLTFGTPIPNDVGPGVSSSIGVSFPGFILTPGDTLEVPFEFVVVPEPGFAALFACSLAVILCAFAREKASTV